MSGSDSSANSLSMPPPEPTPGLGDRGDPRDSGSPVVGRGAAQAPEGLGGPWTWLLGLGILATMLLRFVRLGQWSLWIDEGWTVHDGHRLWEQGPMEAGWANSLGYYLVESCVRLAGGWPNEFVLRVGPAAFGALSIPLAFWAFRPLLTRSRCTAVALLLGCSAWHLYWSQNARFYTLAQFLGLAATGFLLRGLLGGSTLRLALGIGLGLLCPMAHLSGGLILPTFLGAIFLLHLLGIRFANSQRKPPKGLLIAAVLLLCVGGIWALGVWTKYAEAKADPNPVHLILTSGFFITPLLGTAALFGALLALRGRQRADLLALTVVVLTFAAALVMSLRARVTAQYIFVILPWILVLATAPLDLLATSIEKPRPRSFAALAWIALLALPNLVNSGLYLTHRHGERPRWREAYEHVWTHRDENDLILGMAWPVGEFYLSPGYNTPRLARRVVRLDRYEPWTPYQWAREGRPMWLVLNREWLKEYEPQERARLQRFLDTHCHLSAVYPLQIESRDLGVWVYRYEGDS